MTNCKTGTSSTVPFKKGHLDNHAYESTRDKRNLLVLLYCVNSWRYFVSESSAQMAYEVVFPGDVSVLVWRRTSPLFWPKLNLPSFMSKCNFIEKKNQEQGKRSPFPFSWPLAHYHFNRKNELRPLTSTWCAWHDLSIACEVQLTWWWGHFKAVICYLNNIKTQISRVENVYTLHAYFSRLTNDTGCGKWRGGKRWHLGRVNRGVSPTALETG